MPKEEGDFGPHTSCVMSSKNTKDKSNGRGGARESTGPGSEKDSGYSDGSDWQQTDVEERRSGRQRRSAQQCANISQSSRSPEAQGGQAGSPSGSPAAARRQQVRAIYIINKAEQERGQLLWGSKTDASAGSGSTRVILVQKPGSAALWPTKASGFLPLLTSLSSVAPPHDESSGGSRPRSAEPAGGNRSEADPDFGASAEQPSARGQAPCGAPSPPLSPATGGVHRRRRFVNTLQILRQSGLLDITLRTKELLRQSAACQRDLAQLCRHTELLCRAAGGPEGPAASRALHRAMAASGSYPHLRPAPHLRFPCLMDGGGGGSGHAKGPPAEEGWSACRAPLLSALLDPGPEPDRIMSPDSSTG